jgi:hypothetical protein
VDNHACRFIDDYQLVVLIKNFQRYIFCFWACGRWPWHRETDTLAGLHPGGRFEWPAIPGCPSIINRATQLGTAYCFKPAGKKHIEPLAVLVGFYDEVEVGGSFVCGHPQA